MTWNPPPEKDRPDGYTCLAYSPPWNGYPSFWTECVWHKESRSWYTFEDWKLMEPTTFAPLPEAAAARIAELEAEVERLRAESKQLGRLWEANQELLAESKEIGFQFDEVTRLTAENERLRALLPEADARIVWEGMEPLGPDFERVWDENLATLYSNDPLPGKDTP